MMWTALPDDNSSDRIYLDELGTVSGLRYSSIFPGGSKALSCVLDVDPLYTHRALTPGRDVGVTCGAAEAWLGQLNAPVVNPDGSRAITADGDAATAQHFMALGLATHNALNPNEAIDAATLSGRHSRFHRVGALTVTDGLYAFDGSFGLDEALTQAANAAARRWRVDLDRAIRFYPFDGDGTELLLRARQDIGRTMDGFVTRLDAVYIDAATGLRNVEHVDASYADTGSTHYPAFYTPDLSAYATGHDFTLYSDGTTITAYAIFAYATADVLSLSSPAVDLTRVETSQFYSKWEGAGSLAVGASGLTGTYRAVAGGPALGTGTQEGKVHRGRGSLGPTGNIAPRESIIDITNAGAFTRQEVNQQLAAYLAKTKTQPHYEGAWTAAHGDLLNRGGVPVDLATVRAGVSLTVLVMDPTRHLSRAADTVIVTTGEVEYDVDTDTLTLIPAASPDLAQRATYIDPATGLAR